MDRSLPDGAGGSGGRDARADSSDSGSDQDAQTESEAGFDAGPLNVCLRFAGNFERDQLLSRFTPEYLTALRAECRLTLLTQPPRAITLPDFANQLRIFNFSLWGCDSRPLTDFDIVFEPERLTGLDVALLIDVYVSTARTVLSLSPMEESAMRAELGRLGALARTSNDPSYTFADCDGGRTDAGDAGVASDSSADSGTADAEDSDGAASPDAEGEDS